MSKRLLVLLVVFLILGMGWTRQQVAGLILIAISLGIGLLFHTEKRQGRKETIVRAALFLGSFFLGVLIMQMHITRYASVTNQLQDGDEIIAAGTVIEMKKANTKYRYLLENVTFRRQADEAATRHHVKYLAIYLDSKDYEVGTELKVQGTFQYFQSARNQGNFNSYNYNYNKQILGMCFADKSQVLGNSKTAWIHQALFSFRERMSQIYVNTLGEKQGGLLSAIVLGEKDAVEEQLKDLFEAGGISHILVVSGMHISLLGMAIYRTLRKRGGPLMLCVVASAGVVCLFCLMSGNGISAKRALGMYLLYLLAQLLGDNYDSMTALFLLALLLLLDNPFLLWDSSFILSFYMVFVVVGIVGPLKKRVAVRQEWLHPIWGGIVIQICSYPVLASMFYEISLYAVVLNLLLLPYLGVVLILGLIGGMLGLLFDGGAYLLYPIKLILVAYEQACTWVQSLPFSTVICGKPDTKTLLLYAGVVCIGIYICCKKKRYRFLLPTVGLALGILLFPRGNAFELSFLDVGQGTGIYLCTEEGKHLFFDGGSTDVKGVGEMRIVPFLKSKGVKAIDYWFLSHLDSDHTSGFYEAIEDGYAIGCVVAAKDMVRDEARDELYNRLEQEGIACIELQSGDSMSFRESSITCLFPTRDYESADRNAKCMVLRFEDSDCNALFVGDIGLAEEHRLLERGMKPVDVFQVAHHGSKLSNSLVFLEEIQPRISVVSCALRNSFGHPSKLVIQNLKNTQSEIYYTMYGGQITIRKSASGELDAFEYI